jgi:SAM-dependent methyltransferase
MKPESQPIPIFRPEEKAGHLKEGERALEIFENAPKLNAWMYSKLASGVGGDVLEIGSGIGNLSRFIIRDAERVMLTDVGTDYLAALRRDLADGDRVQVAYFDLEHEPPPEVAARRFDCIVAVNVIEHLRDDVAAVKRLAALLKPGGRLLTYVPAGPFAYGPLDLAVGHYRRYTASSVAELMRSAGLVPDQPRYMNFFGVFGWFFNGRVLRRRVIPPSQVSFFERVVDLVRIEDRFRLPLGLGVIVHATIASGNEGHPES